ncbi:MAG: hypothetical protein LBV47_07760 [Bacteroidales bacterium]|jgi:hypothetical protein|nr:hypothetical protein [Bacteroidales bacterium]
MNINYGNIITAIKLTLVRFSGTSDGGRASWLFETETNTTRGFKIFDASQQNFSHEENIFLTCCSKVFHAWKIFITRVKNFNIIFNH